MTQCRHYKACVLYIRAYENKVVGLQRFAISTRALHGDVSLSANPSRSGLDGSPARTRACNPRNLNCFVAARHCGLHMVLRG